MYDRALYARILRAFYFRSYLSPLPVFKMKDSWVEYVIIRSKKWHEVEISLRKIITMLFNTLMKMILRVILDMTVISLWFLFKKYKIIKITSSGTYFRKNHNIRYTQAKVSYDIKNDVKITPKWSLKIIFQSYPIHFNVINVSWLVLLETLLMMIL